MERVDTTPALYCGVGQDAEHVVRALVEGN
jgi:hypothetical protein